MKYTVLANHGDYAEGIFDTEKEAESWRASLIRADEPGVSADMSDDFINENFDFDGYYRVITISLEE